MNFNRKMEERFARLHYIGFFSLTDGAARSMRRVVGRIGTAKDSFQFALYWLVDESDGVIADAKFQAFGPPLLLVALDATCELLLRKTYDQASRISADLIDFHLREKPQVPAFPIQHTSILNKILDAIDHAVEQCLDIPFTSAYDRTPLREGGEPLEGIANWDQFSLEQKLSIIEEVISKEVRPYIELDAGGIKVLGLRENGEVRISYEGACTSCHSSTGSTLSAIQHILRSRINPVLSVVPE